MIIHKTPSEKLQRAIFLLQLIISDKCDHFEVTQEIRDQLRDWGIKVPKSEFEED